jgi:hypothetical protein
MRISGVTTAGNLYASTINPGRSAGTLSSTSSTGSSQASQKLTPDEQKEVQKLKERDRQVRLHEQAHMSAGAGLVTSSASFTYQKGPDGVNYAIGGEVGISTSPGRTPDETIQRAQKIRSAALAPADPSGQDRAVATQAAQMEQQAQMEKSQSSDVESKDAGRQKLTGLISAYAAISESRGSGLSAYA